MKALVTMIDEPEGSRGFIEYAVRLAKDLKIHVHLLYVENPNNYALGTPNLTGASAVQLQRSLEERIKHARATLGWHVDDLKDQISGEITVDISAEIDIERSVLERMTGENEDQMVVTESGGIESFWAGGSSTREIIRAVSCPVWVIPTDAMYQPFSRIIYATDYHQEDIPTLMKVISLTRPFAPRITAIHITDSVDFDLKVKEAGFQEMIRKRTDYQKIHLETLIEKEGDHIAELINSYAEREGADLIVMLKENRNFLERIFRSSSTRKIIKHVQTPVLVYHEQGSGE
jgi:nucleotide-binding universal stress UspA family protein